MESVSTNTEQYEDPRDLLRSFVKLSDLPRTMMYGQDLVHFIGCDLDTGFVTVVHDRDRHEPDWFSKRIVVSPYQLTVDGIPLLELARTRQELLTTIQ